MNGIGLMGLALFEVGVAMLVLAILLANTLLVLVSLPFSTLGVLGLVDDLILDEAITRKLLGIKKR